MIIASIWAEAVCKISDSRQKEMIRGVGVWAAPAVEGTRSRRLTIRYNWVLAFTALRLRAASDAGDGSPQPAKDCSVKVAASPRFEPVTKSRRRLALLKLLF